MAQDADDESAVVIGQNGERVLPTHGSAGRNREHDENLAGSHGPPTDDQSMKRFDPLGSFRPPAVSNEEDGEAEETVRTEGEASQESDAQPASS
jgi:hypothetical protein